MSNDRKSVLSAVFWKFAERIGAQLVSVIVSIVLTRLLSPDEYGIIPLVLVFITIANVFVDSGFGMSLIQKKDADDIDFSTVFYFSIAFSSFLYLILFFLAVPIANYYGMPILVPVLRVLAVSIVIRAINSVQQAYVARKMIFKKFFVATIIGTVTSGVVGIILAYFGFGVWALVFQTLINNFMDTVILQFTIEWRPIKAFSFKRLKEMFNFGWKLLLQSFVLQLYANLRSLVIGKIYTPADLAFYTKGNQFPDLISTNVDTSISTVLFPVMSQSQESKERVKALARKSTHLTSYIMNPIMIGFIVIAEPFILLLMTDKWLPAVPYLQIYCI
ncbi:MAG: lipopolysaccharide biosynthesis protein, partial [Oscillospiraceae bacterium]|nr:lipopolysaccharide biosynthesis protein [Oscillospiraceae bacterium]